MGTEPWERLPPHLRDSVFWRVAAELDRVKDDERMLVLVTRGFVELLVNTVIDAKCKHAKKITGNNRDYSLSVKLVLLHELGLMSDDNFRRIDTLRKIRNQAAHDPIFRMTTDDLGQLSAHAQKVVPGESAVGMLLTVGRRILNERPNCSGLIRPEGTASASAAAPTWQNCSHRGYCVECGWFRSHGLRLYRLHREGPVPSAHALRPDALSVVGHPETGLLPRHRGRGPGLRGRDARRIPDGCGHRKTPRGELHP